jgi:biotin carboxyl carrier protein
MEKTYRIGDHTITVDLDRSSGAGGVIKGSAGGEPVSVEVLGNGVTEALVVDGRCYRVAVARSKDRIWVSLDGEPIEVEVARGRSSTREKKAEPEVKSPIAGKLQRLFVQVGDTVQVGQKLLSIEAMKMENEIHATLAGTVEKIAVTVGQPLQPGDLLLVVKAA